MKILKRSLLFILMIATLMLVAFTQIEAYNLVPIRKVDDSGNVTYRNTNIEVQMPDKYIEQESDFRAVWISYVVGDLASFTSEAQYKAEINRIFKVMEYYNLNAMVFHVRMYNDALYKSTLNPVASYFKGVNFSEFDPLKWIIEESHKRGIEFHAWMNPYRVASGGNLETITTKFPKVNPASKAENLLAGDNSVILNPGEPSVRKFLVDTVMELVQNYDVDGIHFDDYFYDNGVNDDVTRAKYNTNNLSLGDFRRLQVDTYIKDLSDSLREYNRVNNKYVQLGISPSGIYQNGSYNTNYQYNAKGDLISPLGSNTAGFAHYDRYLYSDTKKWVDNEWIDYILPQSYWALEHPQAGYADVMDWWNAAVKNKKVNLYSGIGIYLAGNPSSTYSWETNKMEAANQIQYSSKLENVRGFCFFSFNHLANAYSTKSGIIYENLKNVKDKQWTKPAILPEIRTFSPITLPAVNNLKVSKTNVGYRIDFDKIDSAKNYVIYRSSTTLTYQPTEIIEIVGNYNQNGVVSYMDEVDTGVNYVYGVIAMSNTNTKGAPKSVATLSASEGQILSLGQLENVVIGDNTYPNETINIKWGIMNPYYGGDVSYAVFKSLDKTNWQKLTSPILNNTTATQKLTLDNNIQKVYVQIKAFNRTGETLSPIYELDVVKRIGTISNFTYSGDLYTFNQIQLKWNLLNLENVSYKVQYSSNGDAWKDITSAIDPVTISGINATQKFTLPGTKGNYYTRVVATSPEGKTISSSKILEVYNYLGDFNIKVNGITYNGPVNVSEMNETQITWDNLKFLSDTVSYRVSLSTDLKTWTLAKLFNPQNTLVSDTNTTTQKLNFDFRYYTVYVKIDATSATGKSVSQIIRLNINVDTILPRSFVDNLILTQKAFVSSMNIYK